MSSGGSDLASTFAMSSVGSKGRLPRPSSTTSCQTFRTSSLRICVSSRAPRPERSRSYRSSACDAGATRRASRRATAPALQDSGRRSRRTTHLHRERDHLAIRTAQRARAYSRVRSHRGIKRAPAMRKALPNGGLFRRCVR